MLKKIILIVSLFASSSCWAADTYNSATGHLTIKGVSVGGTIYNNVVITVGAVIDIRGGNPTGDVDIYDPIKNQLSIPSVVVNGTTYTNVVILVGQIVSIGASDTSAGNSSNGSTSASGGTTGSTNNVGSADSSITTNSSSVLVTTFIAIN
jgi:hypothetical protein